MHIERAGVVGGAVHLVRVCVLCAVSLCFCGDGHKVVSSCHTHKRE
jgi:hypothetical protein